MKPILRPRPIPPGGGVVFFDNTEHRLRKRSSAPNNKHRLRRPGSVPPEGPPEGLESNSFVRQNRGGAAGVQTNYAFASAQVEPKARFTSNGTRRSKASLEPIPMREIGLRMD